MMGVLLELIVVRGKGRRRGDMKEGLGRKSRKSHCRRRV
ncbi:hypothetical protein LINPERHAP1_LOCUS34656 [Linum perenne]